MTKIIVSNIYTPQEYLELEINSHERHEYINGEIISMTGGTPNHNKIALNFASILNFACKRKPLQVFINDQRLWIPNLQIYTYPDIILVQGTLQFQEGRKDTITNPLMITEVLSKSTRTYDKDQKFVAYKTLPSFSEYILIDQYTPHVEQYSKTEDGKWLFCEYDGINANFSLTSIALTIELIDLYDKVEFTNSEIADDSVNESSH
jgi:Uma2 family endonuclease